MFQVVPSKTRRMRRKVQIQYFTEKHQLKKRKQPRLPKKIEKLTRRLKIRMKKTQRLLLNLRSLKLIKMNYQSNTSPPNRLPLSLM